MLKENKKPKPIATAWVYIPKEKENKSITMKRAGQLAKTPEYISKWKYDGESEKDIITLKHKLKATTYKNIIVGSSGDKWKVLVKLFKGKKSMVKNLKEINERDDNNKNEKFWKWFGSSKVIDTAGNPLVVYHGTKRPDRIGTEFKKSRATSGPMAFFTDDPEIASNYSASKSDSSIEYDNYYDLFYINGINCNDGFRKAWSKLPYKTRNYITKNGWRITSDDDREELYLAKENEDPIHSNEKTWKTYWIPREGKGNPLLALWEMWVHGGALIYEEEKFIEILKILGIDDVRFDDPDVEFPSVFGVYLSIQNPFFTGKISQEVINAFEEESKKETSKAKYPLATGLDPWDKRTKDPLFWIETLHHDIKDNGSSAWTTIPDWVTLTLQRLGYDGIKDSGGKYSGVQHVVWIPFEETQIKSVNNKGTWNPRTSNIMEEMEEFTGKLDNNEPYWENPSGETILSIIKKSPVKEIRFTILKGSTYYIVDSFLSTHQHINKKVGPFDSNLNGQVNKDGVRLYEDQAEYFFSPDNYLGFDDEEFENENGDRDCNKINAFMVEEFKDTELYKELSWVGFEKVTIGSQLFGSYKQAESGMGITKRIVNILERRTVKKDLVKYLEGAIVNEGKLKNTTLAQFMTARPLPKSTPVPQEGQYQIIVTDDDQIFWQEGKPHSTHYTMAKELEIPFERIESGGYAVNGNINISDYSDSAKLGAQYKAKRRVKYRLLIDEDFKLDPETKEKIDKTMTSKRKESFSYDVTKQVLDTMGKTNDLTLAGYITKYGDLIDFSGGYQGSGGSQRYLDHADIDTGDEENQISWEEFMDLGNIRMSLTDNMAMIHCRRSPDYRQDSVIQAIINEDPRSFDLELEGSSEGRYYKNYDMHEYDYIMQDIEDYYSEGWPQRSEYSDYSESLLKRLEDLCLIS